MKLDASLKLGAGVQARRLQRTCVRVLQPRYPAGGKIVNGPFLRLGHHRLSGLFLRGFGFRLGFGGAVLLGCLGSDAFPVDCCFPDPLPLAFEPSELSDLSVFIWFAWLPSWTWVLFSGADSGFLTGLSWLPGCLTILGFLLSDPFPAMSFRSASSSRQVIPMFVKLLSARAMALVDARRSRCLETFELHSEVWHPQGR